MAKNSKFKKLARQGLVIGASMIFASSPSFGQIKSLHETNPELTKKQISDIRGQFINEYEELKENDPITAAYRIFGMVDIGLDVSDTMIIKKINYCVLKLEKNNEYKEAALICLNTNKYLKKENEIDKMLMRAANDFKVYADKLIESIPNDKEWHVESVFAKEYLIKAAELYKLIKAEEQAKECLNEIDSLNNAK